MKYYQWLGNITGVTIEPAHFKGKWWMSECTPVVGWDENLVGTYTPRRFGLPPGEPSFNYGLAINGWPVCSPALRAFLEQYAPGLVQFLPFKFQLRNPPRELSGYCVCQFLRFVDCLDRKRTKVRNNWEPINDNGDVGVRYPVTLKRALIGDEKLFRIKGYSVCIVIRGDLFEAMEQAGLQGQGVEPLQTS